MQNAFDRNEQNVSRKAKIIVAIERLSTIFRSLLLDESKALKISSLQTQILLFIAHHNVVQCTVSTLAQEFAVTRPTVSDAVRVLLDKQLLQKCQDATDARFFALLLTKEGKKIVKSLSSLTERIVDTIDGASDEDLSVIWNGLILLIEKLQHTDAVPVRMCFTCQHFGKDHTRGTPHYCHLMNKPLKVDELRIDCTEYQKKSSDGVMDSTG